MEEDLTEDPWEGRPAVPQEPDWASEEVPTQEQVDVAIQPILDCLRSQEWSCRTPPFRPKAQLTTSKGRQGHLIVWASFSEQGG
jgi:hypothetical protein